MSQRFEPLGLVRPSGGRVQPDTAAGKLGFIDEHTDYKDRDVSRASGNVRHFYIQSSTLGAYLGIDIVDETVKLAAWFELSAAPPSRSSRRHGRLSRPHWHLLPPPSA